MWIFKRRDVHKYTDWHQFGPNDRIKQLNRDKYNEKVWELEVDGGLDRLDNGATYQEYRKD